MGALINTTTMTVDAVTDVGEWFVSGGAHDGAARSVRGVGGHGPRAQDLRGPGGVLAGTDRRVGDPQPAAEVRRLADLAGPLQWNSTLIEGDAVEGVARLKESWRAICS